MNEMEWGWGILICEDDIKDVDENTDGCEDTAGVTVGDIEEGKVTVLFSSPESLIEKHRKLISLLSKRNILKGIFCDEAHCIHK